MRRTAVAVVVAAALFSASMISRPKEPAASAAAASPHLLFNGGFETGSYKPWSMPQCANYGNPTNNATRAFGNFNLVSDIVGEGAYAARFDLPADPTHLTRCQVITKRPVNAGGDDYYSLMFYLPKGWTTGITPPQFGVIIAQLNYQGLGPGSPNISLIAFPDHVTLVMATGITTTTGTPTYQFSSNADVTTRYVNLPKLYAVPPGMQLGVWHELIIHAHWATDSSGKIDAWHRIKGRRAWQKTASLRGYPTLEENPDGSYPPTTIDMIGAYRMRSAAPTSVWLDGFSRSGSFAAGAAHLP